VVAVAVAVAVVVVVSALVGGCGAGGVLAAALGDDLLGAGDGGSGEAAADDDPAEPVGVGERLPRA
jgi:hypothetical protein